MSDMRQRVDADPYRELAAAIIGQACSDYRLALTGENVSRQREIESFFRSDWFRLLSLGAVDGERAIRALRGRRRRGGRDARGSDGDE